MNFAELTGTPKQIAWAESIRARTAEAYEAEIAKATARAEEAAQKGKMDSAERYTAMVEKKKSFAAWLFGAKDTASWWIKWRWLGDEWSTNAQKVNAMMGDFGLDLEYRDATEAAADTAEADKATEAAAEATEDVKAVEADTTEADKATKVYTGAVHIDGADGRITVDALFGRVYGKTYGWRKALKTYGATWSPSEKVWTLPKDRVQDFCRQYA